MRRRFSKLAHLAVIVVDPNPHVRRKRSPAWAITSPSRRRRHSPHGHRHLLLTSRLQPVRFGVPRALILGVQRVPERSDVGDAAAPAGAAASAPGDRRRGRASAPAGHGHDGDLLPRPAVAQQLPARPQPRLRLLRALPLLRHHLQQRGPPLATNPPPRHVPTHV
jgi:hypothetical protein